MSSTVVALSDDGLLAAWTELETQRRQLVSREHAVIAEVAARGVAQARGARSTADLASQLLRITAGEAKARVQAAEDIGPRYGLTGEQLEPIYPLVAAAQAEGVISAQHARVIIDTVEKLPDAVRPEHEQQVEAQLVDGARLFDPTRLASLARRISALLDPDGLLKDVEYRHRHRFFDLHRRPDGSGYGQFDLDVECAEYLDTALQALSGPKPAADGLRDARSPGQRRHDAMLDLIQAGLRAGQLPSTNGVTTAVIITADNTTLESGDGLVCTGTGTLIPVAEAARWIGGDTTFYASVIERATRVSTYSTGRRLFSQTQRIALIARDKGCSFPGCTAPPAFCQAHHIRDHSRGGPTAVSNGTLLCRYHHREFTALGFTCQLIDNTPHWTGPAWLDPQHVPRRNTAHDI